MNTHKIFDTPVFGLGFRVFFALAGLSALILIMLWNAIFKGTLNVANYFLPSYWHAHEMLLGYSVAVIAGFLLTAVKNWTAKPTLNGDKLAALALLWLYGRILPFYADLLPDGIIAAVDFSFLPVLAYCISGPILQAKQYKQLVFVGLLLVLALGNALIHAQMLGLNLYSASLGIQLVVGTIITMIILLSGRIFPYFTERALSGTFISKNPLLDVLSIGSAVLVFVLQLSSVSGGLLAITAVFAAAVNAARLSGWYVSRIWYMPLLWALYVGYAWLIIGFVLTALSAYSWVLPSLALHAFTLGGIGSLTLAMMARVSLGHTGRALRVSNAITIAFVLLNLAAVFRVLLPFALPHGYDLLMYASTLCWIAAFSLFMFVYAPILTIKRIDGLED